MTNNQWVPKEIIVDNRVKDDPVTTSFLSQCPGVPLRYMDHTRAEKIVEASDILRNSPKDMLHRITAGKAVVLITAPGNDVVDAFTIPDNRLMCPHFERFKFASNGCFYKCDWCYLKLTFRSQRPFITVRVQYDKIKAQIEKRLNLTAAPVMFNSGELADSLSMEHLTGAMREFVPWFGQKEKGYLFLLTKSANVDSILDLDHNGHTIIAWSMNNEAVSRKFEIGAPGFEQRLEAAYKVQQKGYPLRIRLDPIVPFDGWEEAYGDTVKRIFERISPERITLGTLRFEEGFYRIRNSIFTTGPELPAMMDRMAPMFPAKTFEGSKRPKVGKYSFNEAERIAIFNFIITEIRKYSDADIALCKESAFVWNQLDLDLSQCRCVCQLDFADMSKAV